MISISTSLTFRSWVVIFNLRRPMAFLSLNFYDTPELAPRMNILFLWRGDFPVSYSNRDTSWNAWNRLSGSCMVVSGILFFFAIRSLPLTFWPLTNSDFPTDLTFDQFHDLDKVSEWVNWLFNVTINDISVIYVTAHRCAGGLKKLGLNPTVVSMEHLQWVWHASREHLPFRSPGFVPRFGTCLCSNCWDQISRIRRVFNQTFTWNTPLYFLDFHKVSWDFQIVISVLLQVHQFRDQFDMF